MGSKGRNGESLIKMLNEDRKYKRKGAHKAVVGGRKRETVPFGHGLQEHMSCLIKSETGTRGGRETRQ